MNSLIINEYLKKNHQKLMNLSIEEVAKIINVSPSAITRFCQKNGFSGFKDFNLLLKQYQNPENKLNYLQNSLTKTIDHLNYNKLKFMAQKMFEAKRVYILGEAFTYLQGLILERKLLRLNIDAKTLNVASEISLILPKEKSVYLFISHSGKNPNIKIAAEKLLWNKKSRPIIFSISASEVNNIEHYSNESLNGHTMKIMQLTETELPSNSLIVAQVLIDYLFLEIFNLDKKFHAELLQKLHMAKKI